MATTRKGYLAYLIRLWQVEQKGCTAWRAHLEDVHSGEARSFVNPEELFEFLCQRIGGYNQSMEERSDHPD